MITLRLEINNSLKLMEIKAVRMEPADTPKDGKLCKYAIYVDNEYAGQLIHPFGDGVSLAKKMFDHYDIWTTRIKNK